MRGDTHAGCGERSGETGPWQHRHRAPDRLNNRGRHLAERGRSPARRTRSRKVDSTRQSANLVPTVDNKKFAAVGVGSSRARLRS